MLDSMGIEKWSDVAYFLLLFAAGSALLSVCIMVIRSSDLN